MKFSCPSCGQHITAESEHYGLTIPCPACEQQITVPTPSPQASAGAMPIPTQQNAHLPKTKKSSPKGLVLAGWLLIGLTCLLALIPGLGFITWIIGAPIMLIAFIIGIIALSKGATTQGILILLAALIVAPVFLIVTPLLTTSVAIAAATGEYVENLEAGADNSSGKSGRAALMGEPVKFKDSTWIVISAKELGSRLSGGGMTDTLTSEAGRYIYVRYQVTNHTNEEEMIGFTPTIKDSRGRKYEQLAESTFYLPNDETTLTLEALPASIPKKFSSIYEVPKDSAGLIFIARSLDYFSTEKPVKLGFTDTGRVEKMPTPQAGRKNATGDQATEKKSSESPQSVKETPKPPEEKKAEPSNEDGNKNRLAELKGELAEVNSIIESERAKYKNALNTINALTNNKRTPVKEGSQAYHRCVAASKVIKAVEAGAPKLKAQKARLEEMIKELEK